MIVLGIYWNTTASIVSTWYHSSTFKHQFFVFPISAYLIWDRCHALTANRPTPNPSGIFLLASLGFLWLLGNLSHLQVVQQGAMIAMLPMMAWILLGPEVCYRLLFPLGFLFFAVPAGEFLVPWLQDFTAFFTVKALQLSNIPVLWEGRAISVPGRNWFVAPECSGFRYILSLFTIGCLFGSLIFRTWARQILFALASLFLPIVVNGFRTYSIVLLAYLSDGELAVGMDHLIYGYVFFSIALFSLCWVGFQWREVDVDHLFYRNRESLATRNQQSIAPNRNQETAFPELRKMILTGTAALMVLVIPLLLTQGLSHSDFPTTVGLTAPPSVTSPWEALPNNDPLLSAPPFPGAQLVVNQSYSLAPRTAVHFNLAYYVKEKQGAELINQTSALLGGEGRKKVLSENSRIATVDRHPLKIQESLIRSSTYGTRLVWHWYWVEGQFTSNPYWAKLLQIKARLWGETKGAALIIVSTNLTKPPIESIKTLQNFLHHVSLVKTLEEISR
jgi:exosortase A